MTSTSVTLKKGTPDMENYTAIAVVVAVVIALAASGYVLFRHMQAKKYKQEVRDYIKKHDEESQPVDTEINGEPDFSTNVWVEDSPPKNTDQ